MGQFQDLKAQAAIIRDEQNSYQNTSLRVGRMFIDILEQLEKVLPDENVKPETLTVEATGTSYKLKFSTLTSDGSVKSHELDLPIATDTKAGVMSPALMKGIKDQISQLSLKVDSNKTDSDNKIKKLNSKLSDIKNETSEEIDDDSVILQSDKGENVAEFNKNGCNFKNAKSNGVDLLAELAKKQESLTNLEETKTETPIGESIDIIDNSGNKIVSVDRNGIKSKGFLDLDGNNIIKQLGNSCILQENKGVYIESKPVSTGTLIGKCYDSNVGYVSRYYNPTKIEMPINVFVKETLSLWIKVNDSWKDEETSPIQSISINAESNDGKSYSITVWSYGLHIGWNLIKIYSIINNTISKVVVSISRRAGLADYTIDVGSVVLNQRTFPTINFNADDTYTGDYGARKELLEFIYNNKIPIDLRINSAIAPESILSEDSSNAANYISYLRKIGLCNGMIYGSGSETDYAACLETTKTNIDNARGSYQYRAIKICGNQHNFLNKIRFDAELEAGIGIIRHTVAEFVPSVITKENPIISTTGKSPSADTDTITDEQIELWISYLKDYIDKIVNFGCISSIMTHQMVARDQYNKERDGGLCGIWEVMKPVMEYALELRNQGKLNIMSMQDIADCLI